MNKDPIPVVAMSIIVLAQKDIEFEFRSIIKYEKDGDRAAV